MGVWRDRCTDGDTAVLGDLRGHIADAAHVDVAVLARETQFTGQMGAHDIAIEQRHRARTDLVELDQQRIGDGGLAGTRQTGKEDGETLFRTRRVAALQLRDHFRKREPFRNVQPLAQPPTQFGAGNIQHGFTFAHLVAGHILGALAHIHHHLERHHLDTQFIGVFVHQPLCLERIVERLIVAVVAGPGVVTTDNKVAAAEVLADQRVPQRLAWPAHAHGQRQQAEHGGVFRITLDEFLIAAHAGQIIDVAGFGHAHHRVDQQIGFGLTCGGKCQFLMRTMHGVAGLKRDHAMPAHFVEIGAQLGRRVAQVTAVVVMRQLNALQGTAQINRAAVMLEPCHRGVLVVLAAKHLLCLLHQIRFPDRFDGQHRQCHALAFTQGESVTNAESGSLFAADVQRDRHRPQGAIGQPQVFAHAGVIGFVQKPCQR